MALRSRLRPFLLLPFILLWQPGVAKAAPSLAEAVKQADAKYLQAPDVDGKDDTPKIEAGSGEDERMTTRTKAIQFRRRSRKAR